VLRSFRIPSISLRPPALIVLLVLAIVGWIGVSQLVQVFHRRLHRLAVAQFDQGEGEMKAGHPARAIAFFHAALSYSPENPQYQLNLARALRETGQFDESQAYLLRLWERKPEDSVTNLALARLAVRRQSLPDAFRYYHNAIYGQWDSDPDQNRRQARLELVQFLIDEHSYNQAQSELIALLPQTSGNPDLQLRVAQLFYAAQDYPHALAGFQKAIAATARNAAALAGAGRSAFQLGRYHSAATYLEAALRSAPDPDTQHLLDLSRLILSSTPFSRRISEPERNRRLRSALAQAGQRLKTCSTAPAPPSDLADLQARWKMLDTTFRRNRQSRLPDPSDEVMNLVLDIEKQSTACGPLDPNGHALLLIAQNPAEVER
jgi:tetratricopeptide (TPR) repeat protein